MTGSRVIRVDAEVQQALADDRRPDERNYNGAIERALGGHEMKQRYAVDLRGWGHVAVKIVDADSRSEALDKALREVGFTAKVRHLAQLAQESVELVTEVDDRPIMQAANDLLENIADSLPQVIATPDDLAAAAYTCNEIANAFADLLAREVAPA